MQDTTAAWLYKLGDRVKKTRDQDLIHIWRKLQTSDHFYYMCTKYWSDGDVHKYFSVYDAPHDSYTIMNNILSDLEMRLEERTPASAVVVPHWTEKPPAAPPKVIKVSKAKPKAVKKTATLAPKPAV